MFLPEYPRPSGVKPTLDYVIVTTTDGAEGTLAPRLLVAVTLNVYF
jgi:hypothetical protein